MIAVLIAGLTTLAASDFVATPTVCSGGWYFPDHAVGARETVRALDFSLSNSAILHQEASVLQCGGFYEDVIPDAVPDILNIVVVISTSHDPFDEDSLELLDSSKALVYDQEYTELTLEIYKNNSERLTDEDNTPSISQGSEYSMESTEESSIDLVEYAQIGGYVDFVNEVETLTDMEELGVSLPVPELDISAPIVGEQVDALELVESEVFVPEGAVNEVSDQEVVQEDMESEPEHVSLAEVGKPAILSVEYSFGGVWYTLGLIYDEYTEEYSFPLSLTAEYPGLSLDELIALQVRFVSIPNFESVPTIYLDTVEIEAFSVVEIEAREAPEGGVLSVEEYGELISMEDEGGQVRSTGDLDIVLNLADIKQAIGIPITETMLMVDREIEPIEGQGESDATVEEEVEIDEEPNTTEEEADSIEDREEEGVGVEDTTLDDSLEEDISAPSAPEENLSYEPVAEELPVSDSWETGTENLIDTDPGFIEGIVTDQPTEPSEEVLPSETEVLDQKIEPSEEVSPLETGIPSELAPAESPEERGTSGDVTIENIEPEQVEEDREEESQEGVDGSLVHSSASLPQKILSAMRSLWQGYRVEAQYEPLLESEGLSITEVHLLSPSHKEIPHTQVVVEQMNDQVSIKVPEVFSAFVPGKYTVEVTIMYQGVEYLLQHEFTRGVLSLNTGYSSYVSGEKVQVNLAALNDAGHTLCQAPLELAIINPDGMVMERSVAEGTIALGDDCGADNVTDLPDYTTTFIADQPGVYILSLANIDTGLVVEQSLDVYPSAHVRTQRIGSMRINPFKASYDMEIKVQEMDSLINVTEVREYVPKDFEILDTTGELREDQGGRYLAWDILPEQITLPVLTYRYQAPKISPYIYVLGELDILGQDVEGVNTSLYQEPRVWTLASDAAGDFAVYRESGGGQNVTTAASAESYDTTVLQGTGFSLTGSNTIGVPAAGHYLVMYNGAYDITDGTTRKEANSYLFLTGGGGIQAHSYSSCHMKGDSGITSCWLSGAAVLDVGIGESIQMHSQRTDSTSGQMARTVNQSGISVLHLDDDWEYLRAHDSVGGVQFPDNDFVDMSWDVTDEIDAAVYGISGSAITLKEIGHYLVTWTVGFGSTITGRRGQISRMTLDGVEVEGSRTTVNIRGNSGAQDQIATYVGIIEADDVEQVLVVQSACDGTTCGNIRTVSNRSGITITKLPDIGEYLRVSETVGGQAVDGTNDPITWDTTSEIDTDTFTFSNGASTASVDVADDYLFLTSFNAFRDASLLTNQRQQPHWQWQHNGTTLNYGSTARYNRGSSIFASGGSSGLIIPGMGASDTVGVINTDQATSDDPNTTFIGGQYALQGVSIGSLITVDPNVRQKHFRWRDDSVGTNTNGGWLADEDAQLATDVMVADVLRMRISVANIGNGVQAAAATYQLQYAAKSTTCSAATSWIAVDAAGGAYDMFDSAQVADGESTSQLLTNIEGFSYLVGTAEDVGDTSGSIGPLAVIGVSEIEYSLEVIAGIMDVGTHCFRVYDTTAASAMDSYSRYPELTIASPSLVQEHFRWRDDSVGVNVDAGWLGVEDADVVSRSLVGDQYRLRLSVANSGSAATVTTKQFELQFAPKNNLCSAVTGWVGVGDAASDSFGLFDSTQITEGESTTALFTNTEGYAFTAGSAHDISDTSVSLGPLGSVEYTELEFALEIQNTIEYGDEFCFRVYDTTAGVEFDTYDVYPQIGIYGGLKVQEITGMLSGATSITLTIPESVADLAKAFLITSVTGLDNGDDTAGEGMCSARLSSVSDVVVEKSNTTGDCRYSIYVVEALRDEFEVRGRGSATLTGAALSATASANNLSVITNTSNTMVVSSSRSDANTTTEWLEALSTIELTNTTTVTAERNSSQGDDTTNDIEYEVVEWLAADVSVQTGEYNFTGNNTPETVTLGTAVDTSRAYVFGTARHRTNGLGRTQVLLELTGSTSLDIYRGTTTSSVSDVRWWVVELPNGSATVSRGSGITALQTESITIPDNVKLDTSFPILTTGESGTGVQYMAGMYRSSFSDERTVLIESGRASGATSYTWQVIDTRDWGPGSLNQKQYRWYANTDAVTPTTPKAAEDTIVTDVPSNDALRLRFGIEANDGDLAIGSDKVRLQYGLKVSTCDAIATWNDVGLPGASDTWVSYDNLSVADDITLPSTLLSSSDVVEQYRESAGGNIVTSIAKNDQGEWDFTLMYQGILDGSTYCFRGEPQGSTVISYSLYPEATVRISTLTMTISDTSIGFGPLTSGGARYATGDELGSSSEVGAHTITIQTNAANGYSLYTTGSTLQRSGGHSIDTIGLANAASTPGIEQFGLRAVVNSGTGAITAPYAAAGFAHGGVSSLDEIASGAGDEIATEFSFRYLGNKGAHTEAGMYETDITYILVPEF